MKAETISIGDELLLGLITDSNSSYIAAILAAHGIPVTRHITVGDDFDAICTAVDEAARRADVVIINGGIGPTIDDLTRQAVADTAGAELILDEEWLETMRKMFGRRGVEMPESNRIQAMLPAGAVSIDNPTGSAQGFTIKIHNAEVSVFPGVPSELFVMFEQVYLPRLLAAFPSTGTLITQRLQCFGVPESLINESIGHLMGPGRNPTVGLLATDGVISVKITASARDEGEAVALIDAQKSEIRSLLGECVFGEDGEGLEHAVARLLVERGKTLCTAESCTGGLIGKRLTDISGSTRYYLGGVVSYSNDAKIDFLGIPQHLFAEVGAVSREVAQAMAEGIRNRMHGDYAVSVTGIAGPTGGTPQKPVGLVYVGLASAAGTEITELRLIGPRDQVRDRSAKFALNMLRLHILRESAPGA